MYRRWCARPIGCDCDHECCCDSQLSGFVCCGRCMSMKTVQLVPFRQIFAFFVLIDAMRMVVRCGCGLDLDLSDK